MITVPARLLDLPTVAVRFAQDGLLLLEKTLTISQYERPSYLSCHAISLVREGRQRIHTDDGRVLSAGPGEWLVLRRGLYTVSDLLAPNGCFRATLLYFGDDHLGADAGAGVITPPPRPRPNKHELLTFLSSIPGLREKTRAPHRQDPLRFLERHFDKPLTLDDLAYLTGSSVSTFQRHFKRATGQSPRRWIIEKRMARARELGSERVMSVNELARAVGYLNTSHFIKQYREHFGRTPGGT